MSRLDEQFDDELPAKLWEDLKRVEAGRRAVPPEIDRLILSSARARLARFGRLNLFLRWGGAVGAIAAAVLLSVYIVHPATRSGPRVTWRADDLNRDGSVDILDAYLLARRIEGGEKMAGGDVNGDGVIDQRDVDALAHRAVSLGKGEGR